MSIIRKIEITNFRCLKSFSWEPQPGINGLIGPGDSGKSTILDAIDYCLGARRNLQLADTDFHCLDVSQPINITITLGKLDDALKGIEAYGPFLRGFDATTGQLAEEPEASLETALTLQMIVASDLEPRWTLVSARGRTGANPQSGLAGPCEDCTDTAWSIFGLQSELAQRINP
ncbi:ATP-dependent endonuclease [Bradyrhizobium sp. USDA 329]|uniref:ATP-dependent nuclease n=1 Tax=unclassified Bradyrhizobium TaxID=2631580 RepID=UPI0035184A8E